MDIYHIWCHLKPEIRNTMFTEAAEAYLKHLAQSGSLQQYRITKLKLGLGIPELGEFHLMLEFEGLAQLDGAFTTVPREVIRLKAFITQ